MQIDGLVEQEQYLLDSELLHRPSSIEMDAPCTATLLWIRPTEFTLAPLLSIEDYLCFPFTVKKKIEAMADCSLNK